MSQRLRIRSLKAGERPEAYLANARMYLESHGAPPELVSTLEQLWRSAYEKREPSKLTQEEKYALLAVRYFAAPGGTGYDVRRTSVEAKNVETWLKRSGRDIAGVDTPEALEVEQLLKTLSRKKRWDVILGLVNGSITLEQAKEEAQKRKPRARRGEAGTRPRRRSRKSAEAPIEAPAPSTETATAATPAPVTGATETAAPAPVAGTAGGGGEEVSREALEAAEQILSENLV
jgi:hypothetical protein